MARPSEARSSHRLRAGARAAHDQNAVRIDLELLAGKDHRSGAELLDHGGPFETEAGGQRGALVDRRLVEGATEIDRAAAGAGRRVASELERGNGRAIDHPEAGDAQIDQLHLLLAGIVDRKSVV